MALINIPLHTLIKKASRILLFILPVLIYSFIDNKTITEIKYLESDCSSRVDTLYDLNMENIEYWVDYYEIKFPEIVIAQIKLETGYLTSDLLVSNNNLFGMRYPRQRETTAKRDLGGYSYYDTWIHSILDYKIWQDKYYKDGDYYQFLNRIYAEDTIYINKLKQIVKK